MKQIVSYIFLFIIFLSGCTEEIIFDRTNLPEGMLVIDSYAAGFEKIQTRTSKTPFEYEMSNRHMFVFDSDGKLIKSALQTGSDGSFLIDRNQPPFSNHNQNKLAKCKIYIAANFPTDAFASVTTLDELLAHKVTANPNTIHLEKLTNFMGLPMLGGTSGVNLKKGTNKPKPIDPIPLKTMYAKVVVDISLNVEQNVPGEIPMFYLKNWQVFNIPGHTYLKETDRTKETTFVTENATDFINHEAETKLSEGTNPISNGGKHIILNFYTLEHRINPETLAKDYTYPPGIKPNEKQRYKPKLVGADQKPMYIKLNGTYFDHQGHEKQVSYTLYLGTDNFSDFHINRNCQLTNYVTIKGITNSQGDGTNVSVDHRVNIDTSNEDFIVKVERETMLDSHIEVRPLDIELKTEVNGAVIENSKVVVEIVDPNNIDNNTKEPVLITSDQYTWMRFEHANKAITSNHCSNGKRLYFTDKLLSDLKNNIKTEITDNTNNRIWVYFDENPNASVDKMREAMLRFTYYDKQGNAKKIEYYKFRQHDLYPIKIKSTDGVTREYFMEYYEEYLYNFDPKDPYTNRSNGMAWGQKGVEYSSEVNAAESKDPDEWGHIKTAIETYGGKYDYSDNYKGKIYTGKLIEKGSTSDGKNPYYILQLDQNPRSAAEYCYNKNKRNTDGNVSAKNFNWYLPAIGEIQDITTVAYSKFKVFQEQFYWSSQTSYLPGHYEYKKLWGIAGSVEGDFIYEDVNFARATKTILRNGKPDYIHSEAHPIKARYNIGYGKYLTMTLTEGGLGGKPSIDTGKVNIDYKRDEGNHERNVVLRVRAIRQTLPPGGVRR